MIVGRIVFGGRGGVHGDYFDAVALKVCAVLRGKGRGGLRVLPGWRSGRVERRVLRECGRVYAAAGSARSECVRRGPGGDGTVDALFDPHGGVGDGAGAEFWVIKFGGANEAQISFGNNVRER